MIAPLDNFLPVAWPEPNLLGLVPTITSLARVTWLYNELDQKLKEVNT